MSDNLDLDFSNLVHLLLFNKKNISAQEIADELGMKYQTFYKKCSGENRFSLGEALKLSHILNSQKIADLLLANTNFIAVDKKRFFTHNIEQDIRKTAFSTLSEASDIINEIDNALVDEHIDHNEKISIYESIDNAEKALAGLRKTVK